MKVILSYAEVTKEDGTIVTLDQEKAYDKIRHDYLWKTLEAFHLPQPFIWTVKALYCNAHTKVAINGVFSETFKVKCGVCQGDPLSCPLFNLAIKPLAYSIHANPNIKGIMLHFWALGPIFLLFFRLSFCFPDHYVLIWSHDLAFLLGTPLFPYFVHLYCSLL